MQADGWFSLLARISLPCILAVIMQLQPVPVIISTDLQAGYSAEQDGNNLKAAGSYARVAQIQPWRDGLLEKAGILYYQNNDFEDAALTLQSAMDQADLSEQGQVLLADAYYQNEKFDQALSVWSSLIDSKDAAESLFIDIAGKLTSAGLIEEEVAVYRQWVAHFPTNAQAAYRLGLLQSVYAPLEAIGYLSISKSLDASLTEPADLLLDTIADLQDADERYRLVIIGRTLGNLGEWIISNQAFQKAIDLDPDYGDAWVFLAESLQQLGKPALEAIEKANELSPDSVGVKALTAVYWRRQNKPERALEIVKEIAKLQPEEYVWLVEIGNITGQTGDLEGALTYFQQAIDADPENPEWRKELITFCLENNYEVRTVALPATRIYLELDHEGHESLLIMGRVMLELKDTISAERYLTRALDADPSDADAHLYLGQLYLMVSNQEQAHNHLYSAFKMSSQNSETAFFAQRLLEKYFPEGVAKQTTRKVEKDEENSIYLYHSGMDYGNNYRL